MKWLAFLLLIPSVAFSRCTVSEVIQNIRPGAQWNVRGTTYEDIEWIDVSQTKPTKPEIIAAMAACQSASTARDAQKVQAKLDVKNSGLTQAQRLQALLILLDYDQ